MAKDDELRAEYATNLYLNEGGVTYSEEDMAAEIANVTYWTWEELENPPFEPGTTMRTMPSSSSTRARSKRTACPTSPIP